MVLGLFRVLVQGLGWFWFVWGSGLFRVVYNGFWFTVAYVCFGFWGCFGLFIMVEGSGWFRYVSSFGTV